MLHVVSELLEISLNSLRKMVEANTIIGNPITKNDITIIPVSRVHLGFVSGGSDIKPNTNKAEPLFGGGTGGGLSLSPIAFLIIYDNDVRILSIDSNTHLSEILLDLFPKAMDKITNLFQEEDINKSHL